MAPASEVLTVELDGHVATLWLDNPDKRNALGEAFWADLPPMMAELSADPEVRAVVLAGRGPMFTAGIDVNFLMSLAAGTQVGGDRASPASRARAAHHRITELQASITSVADCPKPVIAAVHGWCIGAGVDLVTACDIRLASVDAKFSVRETRMAIVADVGTLQRLPRIVGPAHAAELAFTGTDVDAERAMAIGLVNRVLDDHAAVVEEAQAMAAEIAALSPLAVQGAKAVLRHAADHTVAAGLDYVSVWNAAFLASDDATEAMMAFLEKRPPRFTGT